MTIIDQPFSSQLAGMLTITKHYAKILYHRGKMSITNCYNFESTTSCQLTEVTMLDFKLNKNNQSVFNTRNIADGAQIIF